MIEGIYQIGSIVKRGKQISEIASDIPKSKEGINYKVGIINFNLNKGLIEIDTLKEYEQGDEDKYKFVNLRLTSTQRQFFCTFTNLQRLQVKKDKDENKNKKDKEKLYSCWLSIEEELEKLSQDEEIKQFLNLLKKVKEEFYEDGYLDFSKIKVINGIKVNGFKNDKEFNKFLKTQLTGEDIVFWTIQINGKNLVDYEFYDKLIEKKVIDEKKIKGKTVCYICGEEKEEYFEDFARLPIKFFINDKVGFSQNLSDRWVGNFALCVDCYISLFAGEKFILNNLKFNIGGVVDVLLIPEFVTDIPFSGEKIKEWTELVKDLYNPFNFIEETEFKKKLNRFRERGYLKSFLLNYVFYENPDGTQQYKVFSVVKDLPNSRIDELRKILTAYKEKVLGTFNVLKSEILNGYGSIYKLIPLRLVKTDKSTQIISKQKISEVFSSILEGIPFEKRFLIREFWTGTVARYFSNKSYFGIKDYTAQKDRDKEMRNYILETHQLLILLNELNLINTRRQTMEINVPEELKRYIDCVGFNEQETALFLLGTLIADIASKQVSYGSKPILNKINFQGMSTERIKILFNEVYEKLKHEKLYFPDKEKVYATAKGLFDKHLNGWNLKPYENVYYLLSGYAYKTALNIEKAKKEVNHGREEGE